jgi:release factor glutamine methyltransferase
MATLLEKYREIKKILTDAQFPEAEAEARLIVADAAGLSLGEIFLKADRRVDFDVSAILEKRLSGMPLAYAMNKKYFMGFPFYVDESVLIPRQDTETVVFHALRMIREKGYETALDLCCGSGCIGISIAKLSSVRVIGSDISADAVAVANKNAKDLYAKSFRAAQGDLFSCVFSTDDMIVSNPPYVTDTEYERLENQVRGYEPKRALVGGLDFFERIAAQAAGHLNPGGALIFEIGAGQKDAVLGILKKNGFLGIACYKDMADRHRVMVCTTN